MYRRRHRHNLDSVTIGRYAGEESNTENTVSVGRKAGYSQQKQWAIAIGDRAGEETQDLNAIAIGILAGQSSQSTFAIAIGNQAGRTTQGTKAIAIGGNAGQNTQSTMAMAIGENAGQSTQGEKAIAIGGNAGQSSQGAGAIAIGENAGQSSQGANSIAIGNRAGASGQLESSIVISTSQSEITAAKKGLYVDPIRNFDDRDSVLLNGNILTHLHETKEVVTGLPKLPGYPADPTSSEAGTLYFNTDKKKVKVYNGTKWIALSDEDDLKKLKAELMAAIAAAAASAGGAGGPFLTGGGSYVAGSSGNVPTVVGGGSSAEYYNDDGTPAIGGTDYYLEDARKIGWENGYYPIFYKDLTLVETVRTKYDAITPLDRDDRPGVMTKVYDNGHRSIEPIPVETWNPPVAAWQALPQDERRAVLNEYAAVSGVEVMISNPSGDGDSDFINTMTGDPFRRFLESR